MKQFSPDFVDFKKYIDNPRQPMFENLLKVLNKQVPSRPTLFEFFMNDPLYRRLTDADRIDAEFGKKNGGPVRSDGEKHLYDVVVAINAYKNAGYDYYTLNGPFYGFYTKQHFTKTEMSRSSASVIHDRESFEKYAWPDTGALDYSIFERVVPYIPEGMKMIVWGHGGVLENIINLVGYEQLCLIMSDDESLAHDLFEYVGSRVVRFYEICAQFDVVGAVMSNDDWGFNTQTMFRPEDMRKYLFPWHKKIAEAAHRNGKPVMLHSCGNLSRVFGDIIDDMKFDGKHSYEDKIKPVEEMYEMYQGRIAILGGMDVDFVCRAGHEDIYNRAVAMLERTATRGGYALGSGNSIPEYVPQENYLAMIAAVNWN